MNKTIQYLNTLLCNHPDTFNNPEHALVLLTEAYGIKVGSYEDTLFVLNYDQINSPKNHPIVKECRSLVIGLIYVGDENIPEFEIASRSLDRFFNEGEVPFPHKINKLIAHEKMDGSLVTLWFDDWVKGEWAYRTRSMIMPENQVNNWERTWKDLIESSLGIGYAPYLNKQFSYILEATAQENRVVVRYPDEKPATLLAVRNNLTGDYLVDEIVDSIAAIAGWDRPKRYKFDNLEDIRTAVAELPNLEEGYVLYYKGKPIGKCKNPAYVAAHHLRGEGLNPKRCLQLVCMGELAEYISVFPEDEGVLAPYVGILEKEFEHIQNLYDRVKNTVSQKEFAQKVIELPESSCLFQMRSKGIAPTRAFFNLNEKSQHKLLEQHL